VELNIYQNWDIIIAISIVTASLNLQYDFMTLYSKWAYKLENWEIPQHTALKIWQQQREKNVRYDTIPQQWRCIIAASLHVAWSAKQFFLWGVQFFTKKEKNVTRAEKLLPKKNATSHLPKTMRVWLKQPEFYFIFFS
jgi:hypothetical protein